MIPVRSDQDLIMERILEDKMVEMDRVMESVRAMKEGINATGFVSSFTFLLLDLCQSEAEKRGIYFHIHQSTKVSIANNLFCFMKAEPIIYIFRFPS